MYYHCEAGGVSCELYIEIAMSKNNKYVLWMFLLELKLSGLMLSCFIAVTLLYRTKVQEKR